MRPTRRVLMTGVSYMIPFVAAGGLLIALGFLLRRLRHRRPDGRRSPSTTRSSTCPTSTRSASSTPCSTARSSPTSARCSSSSARRPSSFLVPALAGYIAYAIADRPGIAPGFVMGGCRRPRRLRHRPRRLPRRHRRRRPGRHRGALDRELEGADLGARADAGAGDPAARHADRRLRDARSCSASRSAWLMDAADRRAQQHAAAARAILLGVILGLMMAFDMGGPLNKVGLRLRGRRRSVARPLARRRPRAARSWPRSCSPAWCPPIALALATVVRPGLFNVPERENGKAGWLLGAVLHHRGRHPVRRGRPAARDPRDHGSAAPSPAACRWRWTSACGPRTAASSCCSPSTTSSATSSPWSPVSSSAPSRVIALKSIGTSDTDVATV